MLVQLLQINKALWCGIDTAFALDRLDQDGDDLVVLRRQCFNRSHITKRHTQEAVGQWIKAVLNFGVTCGGQRRQGAAMEGFFHDDDFWLLILAIMPV